MWSRWRGAGLIGAVTVGLILLVAWGSAQWRGAMDPQRPPVAEGYATTEEMELRRKIGQMIMVGFEGATLAEGGVLALLEAIAGGHVGGVLYLADNVASKAAVNELNRAFAEAAGSTPLFIALDQEGGRIVRLTRRIGFAEVESARWIGANMDAKAARDRYGRMARDLAELGFNTNLGPVVDLDVNPANPVIAKLKRSYSADEHIVTAFGKAFVEGHRDAGLATALKHFPGHGSSAGDSHYRLPDISRSWSRRELIPYRKLIERGLADMVMVGHLRLDRHMRADAKSGPATLSKALVTGLLREQLNYDGVVISDDLEMGAIRSSGHSLQEAAIGAVRAGTDILILSNIVSRDPALAGKIVDILAAEARRDRGFRDLIEASHRRISELKQRRFGAGPA